MTNNNKSNLGAPIAVIRKQLSEDPEVLQIAEAFKIPLETYIDMVLKYAEDPDLEPELTILDEEEIQTHGETLPTQSDVLKWLEAVENGQVELSGPEASTNDVIEKDGPALQASKFTGVESKKSPRKGQPFKQSLSSAKNKPGSSVLKEQLSKRRAQQIQQKNTKQVPVTTDN